MRALDILAIDPKVQGGLDPNKISGVCGTIFGLNILILGWYHLLAPRGAWLRQKSCQEISCCRSVGIKEVGFV